MNQPTLIYLISAIIGGYLFGSISTAAIIAKIKHVDLAKKGSGNLGGSNAGRVMGKKYGLLVIILDALKVFFPVVTIALVGKHYLDDQLIITLSAFLCALTANIGHSYPLFNKFRGGKSVSTILGTILALLPFSLLGGMFIFLTVLYFTRYVSVSSLSAIIVSFLLALIPVLNWGLVYTPYLLIVYGAACALAIYRHHSNIVRLIRKKEHQVTWFGRKKRATK